MQDSADWLKKEILESLAGDEASPAFTVAGSDGQPSRFDVTGLAASAMGAALAALRGFVDPGDSTPFSVDRALASHWFDASIEPQGWQLPPIWDAIAGVYRTKDDNWIRIHTNASSHRAAALRVLDCEASRDRVAETISRWDSNALEQAIVDADGCAAVLRSATEWNNHPQGKAVKSEPLIAWSQTNDAPRENRSTASRGSLDGVRILDCTRVLAGPVSTRFLAGFGADVLRIDPPDWQEDNVVPEITLGKRLATLDLKSPEGRAVFLSLLSEADVFVHGYRPGALDAVGLGQEQRLSANPQLIETTLSAYGWSGPWAKRRGYDSLVQFSSGIAYLPPDDGAPISLPVQALDHATGYLMAASVLRALRLRDERGECWSARLSLARTASLLQATESETTAPPLRSLTDADWQETEEQTDWGKARRLRFPVDSTWAQPTWTLPARSLHSDTPRW
ncbi:MAG: CoA transferase, partial [Pseudomonadota bacterium]